MRALWQGLRALLRSGSSLYTLAAWSAARFPDAPALVEAQGRVTFRELLDRSDRIAAALAAHVPPGAMVGLLGRNHVTFVATLLATQRLGLRAVLLNTSWSAQQTLDAARAQRVQLLLADDDFLPGLGGDALHCWSTSQLQALERAHVPGAPWHRRAGSIVILTSGSTGAPRAVVRQPRAAQVLPTVTALLEQLHPRLHAPTLLTIPLFHGHGLSTLALAVTLGAPLHLFTRTTPEMYARALSEADIEVLVVVPTVLHRLLEVAGLPRPARLRTIICGSAPLRPELVARTLSHFGMVLYNLYGATECGLVSLATPQQLLAAPDSVGSVLPGVSVTIRRPDGTPAPFGELGEVTVQGAMAQGDPAGVRTGDLGVLSPSGRLRLAGRRDDLLICGGENVHPEAVEARIETLDFVRECAVVGVPCGEYGQRLAAFLVLQPSAGPVTPERLERAYRALLPRMLRPARTTVLDQLPRNALGKLDRHALRRGATSS